MEPSTDLEDRLALAEERLDALEAEVATLRRALAETALAAVEDLNALSEVSPLHGSGHTQARLASRMPAARAIVLEYLGGEDSYASRVARTARQMQQTHAQAERGRTEGMISSRRRVVIDDSPTN